MSAALTNADAGLIQQWVIFIHEIGRVPTQMPATVDPANAGSLASRLQTPDSSLGSGPAQWDYELAPPPLVDLWAQQGGAVDSSGFLTTVGQALVDASNAYVGAGQLTTQFLQDIPQLAGKAVGTVVHAAGVGLWAATEAVLGFSPWWIIGGVAALGAFVLFNDNANRTARRGVRGASRLARAAVL